MKERRMKVQEIHPQLSKRAKAHLLNVNLSSCYVRPKAISEDACQKHLKPTSSR